MATIATVADVRSMKATKKRHPKGFPKLKVNARLLSFDDDNLDEKYTHATIIAVDENNVTVAWDDGHAPLTFHWWELEDLEVL